MVKDLGPIYLQCHDSDDYVGSTAKVAIWRVISQKLQHLISGSSGVFATLSGGFC